MGKLPVHGMDYWSYFNSPGGLAKLASSEFAIGSDLRFGLKELSTVDLLGAWKFKAGTLGFGISQSGRKGNLIGFISSLSNQVYFSVLWRKYDSNFHSFYANAFAESTPPANEQDVYLGIQIKEEQKDRKVSDTGEPSPPYQIGLINKINGLLSLEYQVSKSFFFRSRILFSRVIFDTQKSSGFMFLQDAQYSFNKFRLTGRVTLFDTDD